MRAAAGREFPDLITRLAPLNHPAPLLPLLHKLVEERAGERRLPLGSWGGLPALPFPSHAKMSSYYSRDSPALFREVEVKAVGRVPSAEQRAHDDIGIAQGMARNAFGEHQVTKTSRRG